MVAFPGAEGARTAAVACRLAQERMDDKEGISRQGNGKPIKIYSKRSQNQKKNYNYKNNNLRIKIHPARGFLRG
jgi:hypothetical protein